MSDRPMTLEGCHGRIDAYRFALAQAQAVIKESYPYVNGVYLDTNNAPWRIETAKKLLTEIDVSLIIISGELAVANPEPVSSSVPSREDGDAT